MSTEDFRTFRIDGTREEIRIAKRTIRRCTFPFEVLTERMERKTGRSGISIRFEAPTIGSNFWGQFTSSIATVRVRRDLTDRWTAIMLLHELGHVVDAFQLNDARRRRIHGLWHDGTIEPWFGTKPDSDEDRAAYYAQAQEGFGRAFMRMFSDLRYPSPAQGGAPYTHPIPESVDEPEPDPKEDPQPDPDLPPPDPKKAELIAQVEDLQDRIERMIAIATAGKEEG